VFNHSNIVHLPQVISLSGFLTLSAVGNSIKGNLDLASDSVIFNFELARSLSGEPHWISQNVRDRCIDYAMHGLEQVLNRSGMPDRSLEKLGNLVSKMEKSDHKGEHFSKALIIENLHIQATLELPADVQTKRVLSEHAWNSMKTDTNFLEMMAFLDSSLASHKTLITQFMSDAQKSWVLDYPHRFRELNSLCLDRRKEVEEKGLYLDYFPIKQIGIAVADEIRILKNLRLVITAVALERFWSSNFVYPDKLTELVPLFMEQVPLDPETNLILDYQRSGFGYRMKIPSFKKIGVYDSEESEKFVAPRIETIFSVRWSASDSTN